MDEHLAFARKSTVREYSESIGVAIAVALLLRAFVVEAFQIPSGSMIPTLEVGDHIFVSKFSYGLVDPVHRHEDPEVRRAPARRRDRLQVAERPQHRLHQARGRLAGRRPSRCSNEELYINGNPISREREPVPCHYGEVPRSGGRDDHDCEHWVETLGSRSSTTILQVPGTAASDSPADRDPAGRRVRHGRQPRQLLRLAQVGHGRHGPDQGAGADHLVVARQPTGWDPGAWFKAIRWNRFFTVVR